MSAQTPTALEQSFRDICAAHDLTDLNVGLNMRHEPFFTVWAHHDQDCANGYGDTIADAMETALHNLKARAVLADEALPVELAA